MARDLIRILGPAGAASNVYTHASGDQPGMLLRTRRRSWDMVLEQPNVPLIDSEVNLMQQINMERIEDYIMAMALPGWLKASGYPASTTVDMQYDPALNTAMLREDSWVVANGKMIHISNPTQQNQDATLTGGVRFSLAPVPTIGTYRTDFVFLEFWRHEISPFPASGAGIAGVDYFPTAVSPTNMAAESPTSSQGMTRDQVFVEGGVANSTVSNDVASTANASLGTITGPFGETSRRIQLRWRIRVVQGVNFDTYKFGFGTVTGTGNPAILAQGGMMSDTAGIAGKNFVEVPPEEGLGDLYLNNAEVYGKGRLFRAGDGSQADANALNTVDGYVFALPMFRVNMGNAGPVLHNGIPAFTDMRQLSHVYIPNHVLHSDQITTYDDTSQAGVYGAAFETTADPVIGRTVKSNVRRNSIIGGGVDGDIAPNTITTYNIANGVINGTTLIDDSITINKLFVDSVGLPTVKVFNRSGVTRKNGEIVVLERDTGQTYNGFYLATSANTGPTATVGVVANYLADGTEADVLNGQLGYIRLYGQVSRLWVDTAVTRGQSLMMSTTDGKATVADGTKDAFGFAITESATVSGHLEVRALVFQRIPELSIRTSKLVDLAVTTAKLADAAVTTPKIAASSVNTGHIVDLNITTTKLADLAVTLGKMAVGSVDSSKIVDGSIQTVDLADASVSTAKIQTGAVTGGVGNIAAGTITSYNVMDRSISGSKLALAAVTGLEILNGAVDTTKLASPAVYTGNIADSQITGVKLADATIPNIKLGDAAVDSRVLAALAVNAAHIQDATITHDKIATGQVWSYNIGNNQVTTPNIADGAIGRSAQIGSRIITAPNIALQGITDRETGLRYCFQFRAACDNGLNSALALPNAGTTSVAWTYVPWNVSGPGVTFSRFDSSTAIGLAPTWTSAFPLQIIIQEDGIYSLTVWSCWGMSSVPWYGAMWLRRDSFGTYDPTVGFDGRYFPGNTGTLANTPPNVLTNRAGDHTLNIAAINPLLAGDTLQVGLYFSLGSSTSNTFTGNDSVLVYDVDFKLVRLGTYV